ncbi:hypothetical protein BRD17_01450 [Halobacteriales archaeon SW_7_68_16]|nr:MAG: hypothetical protein BRD17_01450 [Halobacteriales archaeon SW_7_68_16]
MDTEPGGGVPERAAFAERLATLKREGSSILVVGATDTQPTACRRLTGGETSTPRRQLFVLTTAGVGHATVPDTADAADDIRVVRRNDGDGGRSPGIETVVDADALPPLGTEIVDTMRAMEAAAGGFEPSELRLCVDSLDPLFDAHGDEAVFRFLHVVTAAATDLTAMGHYHLDRGPDSDAARLLEPLFDATIEVRRVEGVDEHRWYLHDEDVTTDWVPVD